MPAPSKKLNRAEQKKQAKFVPVYPNVGISSDVGDLLPRSNRDHSCFYLPNQSPTCSGCGEIFEQLGALDKHIVGRKRTPKAHPSPCCVDFAVKFASYVTLTWGKDDRDKNVGKLQWNKAYMGRDVPIEDLNAASAAMKSEVKAHGLSLENPRSWQLQNLAASKIELMLEHGRTDLVFRGWYDDLPRHQQQQVDVYVRAVETQRDDDSFIVI